jgi:hypothetical protein
LKVDRFKRSSLKADEKGRADQRLPAQSHRRFQNSQLVTCLPSRSFGEGWSLACQAVAFAKAGHFPCPWEQIFYGEFDGRRENAPS